MTDILLATYNGALHLELQLASLLTQSYKNWNLLISDDGSTDSTLEILERYSQRTSRIKIVNKRAPGHGVGPALNFLHLLQFSTSEHVIFCDQDDIWFDKKIELMLTEIKSLSFDKATPILLFGRGYHFYDAHPIISGLTNTNYPKELNDFLFLNGGIQGCSIIINRPLIELCFKYSAKVVMHDHYLSLLAFSFGVVQRLDRPLMLYRHHSANVTKSIGGGMISKIIYHLLNSNYLIEKSHYSAVKSFYLATKNDLSHRSRKIILTYLKIPKKTRIIRLYFIIKYRFSVNSSVVFCLYKTLLGRIFSRKQPRSLNMWSPSEKE